MEYLEFERPLIEIEQNIVQLKEKALSENMDFSETIAQLEGEVIEKKKKLFKNLTPSQRLKIARHPKRPMTLDYINEIFTDFYEIHGDRYFGDDPAIVCGFVRLDGKPLLVLGQEKGRETKDKLYRNFGTAHPEGYRKAMRCMKMADKFNLPIIVFIDTPGAYPGITAEERGQAWAIAHNLREMVELKVPIIPIIIGEGGSGGALGIGVGDKIVMLEHSYYSVISPEGCAAILWKNQEKAPEAAESLKMTASDLIQFGIVDEVIEEPLGGAHRDLKEISNSIKESIKRHLKELSEYSKDNLITRRYEKFRQMGVYLSGNNSQPLNSTNPVQEKTSVNNRHE